MINTKMFTIFQLIYNSSYKIIQTYGTILLILLAVAVPVFFSDLITFDYKVKFYTISHLIRTLFLFLIPILILPFFINAILGIKSKGIFIIPFILILVWLSNFTALLIPYGFSQYLIPYYGITGNHVFTSTLTQELIVPLLDIDFPALFSIPEIMIIGLIVGAFVSYFSLPAIESFLNYYYDLACAFFTKVFTPILPIYIFGSMLKISYEINFISLLPIFGKMILSIVIIQKLYIFLLFFIANGTNFLKTIFSIKNSLPAFVVGFSTMSSVITLPVTLNCAEKNTQNKEISKLTISSTVNCHDIGESISLPIIALTILFITNLEVPTFSNYLWFILPLSLAQFSGASVPGGSVAIMLPLLISCFGFSDEMASLMIALSIIMDPIGTANNVMGNSAFVIFIDRLYSKFTKKSFI